jgi:phosphatidylethanolamine/phosphatidyl-N-methylethanolamine N-methyltransferase
MRTFFKALFLNPRAMGAVFPSSKYLARCMAKGIDKDQSGFVLELGPGTGAITKTIIESGIPGNKIIALELAPHLATQLKEQFSLIQVIRGDAKHLSELLNENQPIQTIISSLPLRSIPKKSREKIFAEISKVLSPGGHYVQFTYSMKNDDEFYPPHFKRIASYLVLRNLPPARVSVFEIGKVGV